MLAPDGLPILGFFRSRTLYHCYGVGRSANDGVNHFQFTLKDSHAVLAAAEHFQQQTDVTFLYGPIRHGAGHPVSIYFRDYTGNVVEYSAEEEIILADASYSPQVWAAGDRRAINEWDASMPPAKMLS